jgi:hypothetical protein
MLLQQEVSDSWSQTSSILCCATSTVNRAGANYYHLFTGQLTHLSLRPTASMLCWSCPPMLEQVDNVLTLARKKLHKLPGDNHQLSMPTVLYNPFEAAQAQRQHPFNLRDT